MNTDIITFLKQSNYIEGEYSKEALEDAKNAWDYLIKQNELNKENILETHRILMERCNPRIAGNYREINVQVGSRRCPDWQLIKEFTEDWIAINNFFVEGVLKTEEEIQDIHIQFEKIHPFEDGNGRIGRILLNWQRVKADLPILVIYEKDKQDYYKWFGVIA